MKGVQCYELFGGIALKIHTFSFSFSLIMSCFLQYINSVRFLKFNRSIVFIFKENVNKVNKVISCIGDADIIIIIIIIMVIFKCYFSGELIALSEKIFIIKKKQERCEHRIRKNKQIKITVHDAN